MNGNSSPLDISEKRVIEDFDRVFPNPIISSREKSPIDGIDIVSVFDESNQAEDPLTPETWLFISNGDVKFAHIHIREALSSSGFIPASRDDALAVADLYILATSYQETREMCPTEIPPEVPSEISIHYNKPPVIVEDGENYIVTFSSLTIYHNNFGEEEIPPAVNLALNTLTIGASVFTLESTVVWRSEDDIRIEVCADTHGNS